MKSELFKLALERIQEIAQLVLEIHSQLETWREKPWDAVERTMVSLRLQKAVEEQEKWTTAMVEYLEKETLPDVSEGQAHSS